MTTARVGISQGLILEMTGVCMHDLREQVNSDYEEISRTLAVQAGGLLVGAIGGGFLHEVSVGSYHQTNRNSFALLF